MERRQVRGASRLAWRTCATLAVLATLALVALAAAVHAQETRWTVQGTWDAEEFGTSVAWVGDWDGDGLEDFAAGSTGTPNRDPDFTPRVVIVSSATGMPLQVLSNGVPKSRFGDRVFAIGDADGDGRTELVVYALGRRNGDPSTSGELTSWDSSGHERWSWAPPTASVTYSAVVGDLDGDSIRDVVTRTQGISQVVLDVVSGATGALIRTHADPGVADWGAVFASLGDVDLDGTADYVVEERPNGGGDPESDLHAISGATGSKLWTSRVRSLTGVVAVEDVDQDGIGDALAFAIDAKAPFTTGWVLSGASGVVFHPIGGHDLITGGVVGGDLDGDGFGDVVGVNAKSPHVELVAYSSLTGLEIAREEVGSYVCRDLDGGVDFDGDGHVDLLCGLGEDGRSGRVKVVGLGGWNDLLEVDGDPMNASQLGNAAALVRDRDGDGAAEILAATVSDVDGTGSHVKVLSSRDGRELSRVVIAGGISSSFLLPMTGVPDVDGDQVDDWLLAAADRTVEVRSGVDDALLRTWLLPAGVPNAVAAAVSAAGHSLVALVTFEAPDKGEIAVHDLTSGAAPLIVKSTRWSSVTCVGDLTGDAVLDWVACDTGVTNGRLIAFSGATGATIWTGAGKSSEQVTGAWRIDDLSGDGKDDLLVQVHDIPPGTGFVVARSGAGGARLFDLHDPLGSGSSFGSAMTALSDVDHDGTGDFAVGAAGANHDAGFVDLYSGKTARLLRRIDGAPYSFFGGAFATVARGTTLSLRNNGRRQPAFLANAPGFGQKRVGRVDLIALSDLFLELDPPSAPEGGFVVAATRGGKPGSLTGLYLVAVDGVPVDQFGEFGFLDSFGEWTTSDVVPPGLSGSEFTLRSYAVGSDGKLSYSTTETLTIW